MHLGRFLHFSQKVVGVTLTVIFELRYSCKCTALQLKTKNYCGRQGIGTTIPIDSAEPIDAVRLNIFLDQG